MNWLKLLLRERERETRGEQVMPEPLPIRLDPPVRLPPIPSTRGQLDSTADGHHEKLKRADKVLDAFFDDFRKQDGILRGGR